MWALASLLVLALTPGGARAELEREPQFVRRVNASIRRGADWLLTRQRADGGWESYQGYPTAMTAIAYHTLRVCGVSRQDPDMVRAYTSLRREYVVARDRGELRTYSAALVMMAIESRARTFDEKSRYAQRTRLEEPDLEWMRELTRFMVHNQSVNGAWRYAGPNRAQGPSHTDYDHSNTQYALLGLRAASRSGVRVPADAYLRVLRHLLSGQERDGEPVARRAPSGKRVTYARRTDRARGWGYTLFTRYGAAGDRAYGSMTAGSVGAVLICRSELKRMRRMPSALDARAARSARDGVAWLGQNFAVTHNPRHDGWHYYYLYALERAGALAGVDWMGEHDWYGEGARYLLASQEEPGSWTSAGPRELSTCFALLFLKRGTVPLSRGAITPSSRKPGKAPPEPADEPEASAPAASLPPSRELEAARRAVGMWGRATGDARERLVAAFASSGADLVFPLIDLLEGQDRAHREGAHGLLVGLTGVTLPYDADVAGDALVVYVRAWRAWYDDVGPFLVFSPDAGRLVDER